VSGLRVNVTSNQNNIGQFGQNPTKLAHNIFLAPPPQTINNALSQINIQTNIQPPKLAQIQPFSQKSSTIFMP
jgi:hypothetical protein